MVDDFGNIEGTLRIIFPVQKMVKDHVRTPLIDPGVASGAPNII